MNVTEILKEGWVCSKCGKEHNKYCLDPDPTLLYIDYSDKIEVGCRRCDYSIWVDPKDKE